MEQIRSTELFSLSIDPVTKTHLAEAAKWARFLAIVGFIFLGLMVLAGIILSIVLGSGMSQLDNEYSSGMGMWANFSGATFIIMYLIMALIGFFPTLYLFRFSNKMRAALSGNDQQELNISFMNLKACLRYMGIITIIILALYALIFVLAILGTAAFS